MIADHANIQLDVVPVGQYFHIMLNAYDDHLDPYEYRLMGHYTRVGTCFQTTRTIAEKTGMSIGKVSQVRKSLEAKGYITNEEVTKQQLYDMGMLKHISQSTANETVMLTIPVSVKVVDRSPHEQGHSSNEQGCSPHERPCSPHEAKKNPLNNNPESSNPISNNSTAAAAALDVQAEKKKDSSSDEDPEPQLAEGVADALRSAGVWKNNWHHAIGWPVQKVLAVIAASQDSDIKDPPGFIVYLLKKGCDAVPESSALPAEEASVDDTQPDRPEIWDDLFIEPEQPTPIAHPIDPDWKPIDEGIKMRDVELAIMGEMQLALHPTAYRTWVEGAKLLGKKQGEQTILIGVENIYIRDHLQDRLQATFQRSVTRILRQPYAVEFVLLFEERVAC